MASETAAADGGVMLRGDKDTPFRNGNLLLLTAAEAAGVKAFLRELAPGIYVKCAKCLKMKYGAALTVYTRDFGDGRGSQMVCEDCWERKDVF